MQGHVFRLVGDEYDSIVMPLGEVAKIDSLTYQSLDQYLPNKTTRSGHQHCFVDHPLTDVIDMSSLI